VNVLTEVLLKALMKKTDNDHKDITVTTYDTAELLTLIKTYLNTDVF
jgi:ssRNA-specific RNase YbeY (16S rRNA maturation enzyme)